LKRIGLLLAFAVFLVSCTQNTKVFTRWELQETMSNPAIAVGTYFWDEFGQYRDLYNLNEEESMLLGRWYPYKDGTYHFFPNHLFFFECFGIEFKDEPTKLLDRVLGTWFIRGNTVYVRIFGVDISTVDISTWEMGYIYTETKREYLMVDPYDLKIIDIREIHPIGYAKKNFKDIEVPESLRGKLISNSLPGPVRKRNDGIPKGIGAVRYLYTSELNTSYGYLSLVPRMAEDNVSGMDIVTNPALVDEYFAQYL
jgi:hypothetical protein